MIVVDSFFTQSRHLQTVTMSFLLFQSVYVLSPFLALLRWRGLSVQVEKEA